MATDYDTYKARVYNSHHQHKTHYNYKSNLKFSVHLVCLARAMRQAKTVRHILGLGSTRSSGRAYTRAPILRDMEMAYLALLSIVWSKNNHNSKTHLHACTVKHAPPMTTSDKRSGTQVPKKRYKSTPPPTKATSINNESTAREC